MHARSVGQRSLLVGFAVVVAAAAAYAVVVALFGGGAHLLDPAQPLGLQQDGRMNLVLALLIAFTYGAGFFEQQTVPADVRELWPLLGSGGRETAGRMAGAATWWRPATRRAAAPGAAIGCALQLLSGRTLANVDDAVAVVFMAVLFALLGVRAYDSVTTCRTLSDLGRNHTRVQLFDSGPLHVFGRVGFRLSRNWFIGSTIASLLFLGVTNPAVVAVVLVVTYGLGVVTLVMPTLGIHERLRDARRRELERARRAIEDESSALFSPRPGAAGERLPALVAYEARVEAVHEWPFDAPMLLRFGLLALVATGSWVGGAIVERLLGIALG